MEQIIIDERDLRWHHFDDPEDPELIVLAAQYKFHELSLEDCVNLSQRAKMDDYGHYLFFVFNTLHFKEKEEILLIGKLCVFAGEGFVVTVSDGESRTVDHVGGKIKSGTTYESVDRLVHALLDYVCDQFQPLIDLIAEEVVELESLILEGSDSDAPVRTFGIKRVLISLRRLAVAHREIINQILRRHPPFVGAQANLYFRDIYDHLLLAIELIEANREMVLGIIDLNMSATTERTNEIVKRLTLFATILLPLNVITGFFGMNFAAMPLVRETFGVGLVCIIMLVTTILTYRYFKSEF